MSSIPFCAVCSNDEWDYIGILSLYAIIATNFLFSLFFLFLLAFLHFYTENAYGNNDLLDIFQLKLLSSKDTQAPSIYRMKSNDNRTPAYFTIIFVRIESLSFCVVCLFSPFMFNLLFSITPRNQLFS